jgi:hypothetical protein
LKNAHEGVIMVAMNIPSPSMKRSLLTAFRFDVHDHIPSVRPCIGAGAGLSPSRHDQIIPMVVAVGCERAVEVAVGL